MADILPVTEKDVCIIGAGMTGLSACKHLMQHGFKPTVLEARDCVGGIWRHTCSITKLQTSRDGYQFSDFIWPEGTPPNPHNEQVVDYLESYATQFHLKERIIFNCKVIEIESRLAGDAHVTGLWGGNGSAFAGDDEDNGGKVWQVLVQRRKSILHDEIEEEWLHFDFLVVCVGRFGDSPKFPIFPSGKGPEIFSGKVLHAMQYGMLDNEAARKLINGKRVIVVGYMKSAIDISMEASDANQGVVPGLKNGFWYSAFWFMFEIYAVHDKKACIALASASFVLCPLSDLPCSSSLHSPHPPDETVSLHPGSCEESVHRYLTLVLLNDLVDW